jgi:hypothetical protein
MGEAVEDILDGLACEVCGVWFDDVLDGGEPPGHPRRCEQCEPTRPQSRERNRKERRRRLAARPT